ncbi:GNAT family N-acetyltransferase [Radiobacillus sp. PE A8.2]|uniref:GNAT family N-acetyltransferase n=1 Tax=Radiobacillus sp. PE A8.2 TaxID=3380349 RepID=UPI00388D7F38
MQDTLMIRELVMDDYDVVKKMETNIEDDYIHYIFPDLIQSENEFLYGLYDEQKHLLAIAGYHVFPGGNAMIGRLRSDHRYLSKGNATRLLSHIADVLRQDPTITWLGANTNEGNKAARRVLEKLGLSVMTKLHSFTVKDIDLVGGENGDVWQQVTSVADKRALLQTVQTNALGNVYPYECYNPLPLKADLFSDQHLESSVFYQNQAQDRFLVIKPDRKGNWYAHVKYFWNDHNEQPGLWETVKHFMQSRATEDDMHVWIDFSQQGFENIPNLDAYDVSDAWILYGEYTKR